MENILYIDDKDSELDFFKGLLSDDFNVDTENQSALYEEHLKAKKYSAILLDIQMPILDGFEVYDKIVNSAFYNNCPIIFKTSHNSEENLVKSLSKTAEYLTHDMCPKQIKLRIRNQIKNSPVKQLGELTADFNKNMVRVNKKELSLTPIEKSILQVLMSHKVFVSRTTIMDETYGSGKVKEYNTLSTHISNLKKQLQPYAITINSTRKVGYKIELIQEQ